MVLYTYKKGSKQEHIIYFWLGHGSSKDEIGTYGHVYVSVCSDDVVFRHLLEWACPCAGTHVYSSVWAYFFLSSYRVLKRMSQACVSANSIVFAFVCGYKCSFVCVLC